MTNFQQSLQRNNLLCAWACGTRYDGEARRNERACQAVTIIVLARFWTSGLVWFGFRLHNHWFGSCLNWFKPESCEMRLTLQQHLLQHIFFKGKFTMNRHSSSSIRTEEWKNVVYMMTERNMEINLFQFWGTLLWVLWQAKNADCLWISCSALWLPSSSKCIGSRFLPGLEEMALILEKVQWSGFDWLWFM